MSSTPPVPELAPRRGSRRPTILLLMAVVALVAVVLGVIHARLVAAERARVARMKYELIVAEARMRRMLELERRDAVTPSASRMVASGLVIASPAPEQR